MKLCLRGRSDRLELRQSRGEVSTISLAITSGEGRLSKSSRDSSLSQVMLAHRAGAPYGSAHARCGAGRYTRMRCRTASRR